MIVKYTFITYLIGYHNCLTDIGIKINHQWLFTIDELFFKGIRIVHNFCSKVIDNLSSEWSYRWLTLGIKGN